MWNYALDLIYCIFSAHCLLLKPFACIVGCGKYSDVALLGVTCSPVGKGYIEWNRTELRDPVLLYGSREL